MRKYSYVILWKCGVLSDVCVFSNLKAANEKFDSLIKALNLDEANASWYLREAFGHGHANTKSGNGALFLMKKIDNFCGFL